MSIDIVPPILSSFIAEYLPKALAAVNLCNIAFLPSFSVHSKKSPSFLLKNSLKKLLASSIPSSDISIIQ